MAETAPSLRDRRLWLLLAWGWAVAFFGFPPSELWPLVFIAPAPLMAWCTSLSPKEGFRAGFFYGAGFFGGLIYWIAYTLTEYGYLHYVISTPILLLFVFYLALYPAVFGWALSRVIREKGIFYGFGAAPFLWVGLEWLRSRLFTGFGWGELPLALWKRDFALALAPRVGILGVLFLMICLSTGFAWILLPMREKWKGKGAVIVPTAALLAWIVLLLAGPGETALVKEGRIGVVQGNIEQGTKWAPVHKEAILGVYKDLTLGLAREGRLDFVLWPETAVPGFIQYK
ncbi:hypothetical protein FDZ71_03925, partial [bacterium]